MKRAKIDFHVHPNLTKEIRTSEEYIAFKDRKISQILREEGIDGVIYTDHIHHPDFWKTQKFIPYGREDMIRIPGAEITASGKKDTLVFGSLDHLRKLDGSFRKKLSEGFRPELGKLYKEAKDLGLKVVSAHHLRETEDFTDEDYSYFDALELDIKNPENRKRIEKIAHKHGLPVVAGSDAHLAYAAGLVWTETGVGKSIALEDPSPGGKRPERREKIFKKCKDVKRKILELEGSRRE
ncbi:MAG: PHP domain-containing protein [Candidatus Aenigmatarchaeota archaeon]